MISINNYLILKPYTGSHKIKAKVSSGFASVEQKGTIVGLKVLKTAVVNVNGEKSILAEGSVVYFSEEMLYTHPWAKTTYTSPEISEPFIIANVSSAIAIEQKGYDE